MLKEEKVFLDTMRDVYGLDNLLVKKKVRALIRAVRKDCAKVEIEKYSGDLSRPFWDLINSFRGNDKIHNKLYKLGCDLQNLEGKVLGEITAAIRRRNES